VEGEVGTQIQAQGGVYTLVHGSAMCAGCSGTGTSTSTGSGAGVVITFITVQTAANLPLGNPRTQRHRVLYEVLVSPAPLAAFKSLAKFSCSFFCAFLWVCCCSTKLFLVAPAAAARGEQFLEEVLYILYIVPCTNWQALHGQGIPLGNHFVRSCLFHPTIFCIYLDGFKIGIYPEVVYYF